MNLEKMSEAELMITLQNYLQNQEAPLEERVIEAMIDHIGSINPFLRDSLIYEAFVKSIFSHQFQAVALEQLIYRLIADDKLFYQIGEVEGDGVYTRSFSVLVIATILEYDHQSYLLRKDCVTKIFDTLYRYVHEEKDSRGYDEEKGWAHAFAHCADALNAIVKYSCLSPTHLTHCLHLIQSLLITDNNFTHGEEERISRILLTMMEVHHNREMIEKWIHECLLQGSDLLLEFQGTIRAFRLRRNMTGMLKCCLVYSSAFESWKPLYPILGQTLSEWMRLKGKS